MTTPAFDASERKHDLNQYWYSASTIATLLEETTLFGSRVAFLSTPSLYFALTAEQRGRFAQCNLFEFDRAWSTDPGFVFFDFNHPEKIPVGFWNSFDYVVVDPPFITREVWAKYMEAVKLLGARDRQQEEALKAIPNDDGRLPPGASPFKVLFTTVLENHAMLEELLGQSLFIPDFRPTVEHLVYQYSCFINYPHTTVEQAGQQRSGLAKINAEIPPEEPELTAARRMANDLRESEQQLHMQMRLRDRTGEQLLPAPRLTPAASASAAAEGRAVPYRTAGAATSSHGQRFVEDGSLAASDPAMKWTHVPAGLTEYAGGASAAPPAEEIAPEDIGPAYMSALKRRELLEQFKRVVDTAFKGLDALARADPAERAAPHQALLSQAESMERILAEYVSDGGFDGNKDKPIAETIKRCADALKGPTAEEWTTKTALALSADATRLFKSPPFNRQKELLAQLKQLKKDYLASRK